MSKNNFVFVFLQKVFPTKKTSSRQIRDLLDRDPGLRQVRREQKDVETRVKLLEAQARVRARR